MRRTYFLSMMHECSLSGPIQAVLKKQDILCNSCIRQPTLLVPMCVNKSNTMFIPPGSRLGYFSRFGVPVVWYVTCTILSVTRADQIIQHTSYLAPPIIYIIVRVYISPRQSDNAAQISSRSSIPTDRLLPCPSKSEQTLSNSVGRSETGALVRRWIEI